MAVAMIQKLSVSAIAERIESNENTRFIATIDATTFATDAPPLAPYPSRSSTASMCMISFSAV